MWVTSPSALLKRRLAPLLLAASVMCGLAGAAAAAETFALEGRHLSIGFDVKELWLWRVEGRFTEARGEFALDPDEITRSRLRVVVRTDSIDTGSAHRDRHLRSNDFFDVEQHPLMIFESTGIELVDQNTGIVSGTLNLLGKTQPIRLKFEMATGETKERQHPGQVRSIRASGVVRRSDWGMTAMIPAISDEVHLEIWAELAN